MSENKHLDEAPGSALRAAIEQACASERAEMLFEIENDPNHPATAALRAEIARLTEALEQAQRELRELDELADRYAQAQGGYVGNAKGVLLKISAERDQQVSAALGAPSSASTMRPTLYTRHPDGFRSIDGATFVPCGSGDE